MENNTKRVLALSSAPDLTAGMCGQAAPAANGIGTAIRSYLGSVGAVATVRLAPTHGEFMQEKSVQLEDKRIWTTLRNSLQLSGYGFGTPVGLDAPRVDVPTGVPPRSRPV